MNYESGSDLDQHEVLDETSN